MLLLQSWSTLGDPMDCSPPGSSVHGILQARLLEWVAISSPRGSFPPTDWTLIFVFFFLHWQADSLPLWYQHYLIYSYIWGCIESLLIDLSKARGKTVSHFCWTKCMEIRIFFQKSNLSLNHGRYLCKIINSIKDKSSFLFNIVLDTY